MESHKERWAQNYDLADVWPTAMTCTSRRMALEDRTAVHREWVRDMSTWHGVARRPVGNVHVENEHVQEYRLTSILAG